MNDALTIVRALAEGFDPRTGEEFAGEGPWSNPDVIRALFLAAQALERANRRDAGKAQANLPPAAGKPWTPEEDARLTSEFQTTKDFRTIAEMHQRTVGAVSARLVRLGLLPRANGRPG
ncbi:MAG TPA: hypothetical protein VFL12_12485 [Thermoanaerobaculia bacterium]|nr:hypothetical protein [Thermoanaerobaculia bacterium]